MNGYRVAVSWQALGMAAVVFGILGAALFWLAPLPMGFVLSLAGFIIGLAGLAFVRSNGRTGTGLLLAGTLISFAALILNIVVFHW
jgi:hypothetical protein